MTGAAKREQALGLESQGTLQDQMNLHLQNIGTVAEAYWWHAHRYATVRQLLPPEFSSLLDFGCGNGAFLRWLEPKVRAESQLYAYDVSVATRTLWRQAPPSSATLLDRVPAEARFDVITALDVIEHIGDDVGALKQAASALNPGGRLIVTVPAGMIYWSDWDKRLGHFRRYSKRSLSAALRAAGLEVEGANYFFSYLFAPALWRRFTLPKVETVNAADLEFTPVAGWVNQLMKWIGRVEGRLLPFIPLPHGTSLYAVARKTSPAPRLGRGS